MTTRLRLIAAVALLLPCFACDSGKSYPVTFICDRSAGADCPPGEACPALPLGADTCGDLPGVLGHPATPVTVGRPLGCRVGLSYGNPYYGDSQVVCTCVSTFSSQTPEWQCPI